jgi:SAM-dependent methyltransferase
MVDSQQQRIQQYYDTTTQWFMRFGSTRKHGSIHRALYIDRFVIDDPTQVIHYLIKQAITTHVPHAQSLLDVGCGVGASMVALGRLLPQLTERNGVTLSNVQADLGVRHGNNVIVASFHSLPYSDQSVDVVIAIESMIHSDQPQLFWREVRRVLRPSGMVFICDDVLRNGSDSMIPVFQKGWHAPNLQTLETHIMHAGQQGLQLRDSVDLTCYLRLVNIPEPLMHVLAKPYDAFERYPLITSTLGSMALQHLLAVKAVSYTMMVFVRS